MVEVFKTNITSRDSADRIVSFLSTQLPDSKINFDLTDCDNILRVESNRIEVAQIRIVVRNHGYLFEALED